MHASGSERAYLLQRAPAPSFANTRILFYAFDVIIHRGRSLRHVPLETRRELLSDIAGELKTHTPLIGLSDTLYTTPAELIPLVKEFGFEGIIAKRKDSCYEPGKRSGAWLNTRLTKHRSS
jgi:ATP-dependent DNA ligase